MSAVASDASSEVAADMDQLSLKSPVSSFELDPDTGAKGDTAIPAELPLDDVKGEVKDEVQDAQLDGEVSRPRKKKKKKKRKTTASRGPTAMPAYRGTGFEEYYADPPMTAEEATAESQLYDPNLPFMTRMQTCIQRFRSRRRLHGDLVNYFNRYLFLGGVDSSPNAYAGWDRQELKLLTPAQRRDVTAIDAVHDVDEAADDRFYHGDDENWCVDFSGVVAGFLGESLPDLTNLEIDPMRAAIAVVENFLNYVLHHEVCPEFDEDILRAREICDLARQEWPMIVRMQEELPGEFNLAAAELFCKPEAQARDWSCHGHVERPEDFNARNVFYSTIDTADNNVLFHDVCRDDLKLVREFDTCLELVHVIRPAADMVQRFRITPFNSSSDGKADSFYLSAIGKVTVKAARIRDRWDHPDVPSPLGDKQVDLFFEDRILAQMEPGMKMDARVGELSGGFFFLRALRRVVPTFHTFLPQELMRHYQRPRANERPAPSVFDNMEPDPDAASDVTIDERFLDP